MYNEEIKRKFLEEFDPDDSKTWDIGQRLSKLEPFERSLKKDISQMSFDEAKEAVSFLGIGSVSTLKDMLVACRKYVNWCIVNDIMPGMSDGFLRLSKEDVPLALTGLFKDESDLLENLSKMYDFDDGYADVPYLVLMWAGMKSEEIIALKDSEIDIEHRTIYNPDGTIMIPNFSDAVYDVLTRYVLCRSATRGHHAGSKRVIKDMSVDTFLKQMLNPASTRFGETYKENSIKMHIIDTYEKLGNPSVKFPTPKNVWKSGRCYHLYMLEQSGIDVCSKENMGVFTMVFRSEKGYKSNIRTYEEYKKTFSL